MHDQLQHVLDHGGHEVLWQVPEHATITPGTGTSIWDGLFITHWVAN